MSGQNNLRAFPCFLCTCYAKLAVYEWIYWQIGEILSCLILLFFLLPVFCRHSPTATVALWGFSTSRMDSGGVSMGLSSSSGAWPSPRDHTGQVEETQAWHSAPSIVRTRQTENIIQIRSNTAERERLLHPPFAFHVLKVSPEEVTQIRQTHFVFLSHFQSSHVIQQPTFTLALCNMESVKQTMWKQNKTLDTPVFLSLRFVQACVRDRPKCLSWKLYLLFLYVFFHQPWEEESTYYLSLFSPWRAQRRYHLNRDRERFTAYCKK